MAVLRPCRNTAAFEVVPDRKVRLDLGAVEATLAGLGYARVVRAGVMLIMRKEVEVSIYRSGKMLLKTRDPEVARVLAAQLLALVLPPEEAGPLRAEDMERLARAALGGT